MKTSLWWSTWSEAGPSKPNESQLRPNHGSWRSAPAWGLVGDDNGEHFCLGGHRGLAIVGLAIVGLAAVSLTIIVSVGGAPA